MHSKETLAEFIYELDKASSFYLASVWESDPSLGEPNLVKGFSYDNTLPEEFLEYIEKVEVKEDDLFSPVLLGLQKERKDIICFLEYQFKAFDESIVFTDKSMYVVLVNDDDEKAFRIKYADISELRSLGYPDTPIRINTRQGDNYRIGTKYLGTLNIYNFLQFATGKYEFDGDSIDDIIGIKLKNNSGESIGSIISGITCGNVSDASSISFDDKPMTSSEHELAAECANHLADLYSGKNAQLVCDDNALNGADRIVDGIAVQSKYCEDGARCVSELFDKSGQFRYWNASDKTPMRIEVPSDKYEAAVQALEKRIKYGGLHGKVKIDGEECKCSVTDPAEAKEVIRKGHFTYDQVKNIAKAETVESIIYDATSGAIIATCPFGISSLLSFAVARWNGEDFEDALKSAAAQGLKVGGVTLVSSVLAGQLGEAGLKSMLVASSEKIVSLMGPKASAVLVNAFRIGKNGVAAMKSASKMLKRSNIITSVASFAVLSSVDVANIFRGRISGGQLFKDLTYTVNGGWLGGAAAGAAIGSVVPGVGTALGGFIGGLVGTFAGGSAEPSISIDEFNEMMAIIQEVFTELASAYLVTQKEAEGIVDSLKENLNESTLKDMFASNNRREFARDFLTGYFEEKAKNRAHITPPTKAQMQSGLKALLEDIADSDEYDEFDESEDEC